MTKPDKGDEITIPAKHGYWDLKYYPWGGSFRRAIHPIDGIIHRVIDRYNTGAARKVEIHTDEDPPQRLGVTL